MDLLYKHMCQLSFSWRLCKDWKTETLFYLFFYFFLLLRTFGIILYYILLFVLFFLIIFKQNTMN